MNAVETFWNFRRLLDIFGRVLDIYCKTIDYSGTDVALTSRIILLMSLAYPSIQVDITDTQLTMGEQVPFTRFLCCAYHDSSPGSAFFGTCRAAELHISRRLGCKNACKGVQSVPVLLPDIRI